MTRPVPSWALAGVVRWCATSACLAVGPPVTLRDGRHRDGSVILLSGAGKFQRTSRV